MSRQLEQVQEERETRRRNALVKALEYGLEGSLAAQGIRLRGFAVKWDAYDCLLTLKGEFDGASQVAFVGGGSVIDCILKCVTASQNHRLRWKEDVYKPSKD